MPSSVLPFVLVASIVLGGCRAASPGAEPTPSSIDVALSDPKVVDTLLHDAARDDDADTVRSLVRRKIDVDRDLGGGRTALTLAAYHRSPAVVHALLEAHASARPRVAGEMGPLTHAAFAGDADVVAALLDAGADPNETNRFGQTPLMFAALFGRAEAYTTLVARGGDEDRSDRLGQTPRALRRYTGDTKAALGFLHQASHEIATFAETALRTERTSPPSPAPAPL